MNAPPPVSDADLAATPGSVIALIQWQARQIARLTARVAELEAQVADLTDRVNKDSSNSSVPPSATHPHAKPVTAKAKSKGRNRSGSPGEVVSRQGDGQTDR
jgi:cell division protein FtsB